MSRLKLFGILECLICLLTVKVNAATCNYEEKATLNNEISNVKANYEAKERILSKEEYTIPVEIIGTEEEANYVSKTDYLSVNILNLTENFYIKVTNDYDDEEKIYQYSETTNGNITWDWHNVQKLVTYTIEIYASSKTGCEGTLLKTINLKLPRFNEYSTYSMCDSFPDYYLCKKFVTYGEIEYETFAKKMNEKAEEKNKKEEEKEEKNNKWYNKVKKFIIDNKEIFIVGGVVIVTLTCGTVYIIIKKRRSDII